MTNVLLRRSWVRMAFLSGAEAARLRRSEAGLLSAAIPALWNRGLRLHHTAQRPSESSPGRTDPKPDPYSETEILSDYKEICGHLHVAFYVLAAREILSGSVRPAPARRSGSCRACAEANPTQPYRVLRFAIAAFSLARHPRRVRPGVRPGPSGSCFACQCRHVSSRNLDGRAISSYYFIPLQSISLTQWH